MDQKATLSAALNLAQSAVQFDSDNDVTEALRAYTQSCNLLSQVLGDDHVRDDHRKLRQIYETYHDRILLLQALHPRADDRAHLLTTTLAASRRSDPRDYASTDSENYASRAYHEQRREQEGALNNADGKLTATTATAASLKNDETWNAYATVRERRERRAMTLESRGRYAPMHALAPLTLQSSPPLSARAAQRRSSLASRTSTESSLSHSHRSRMGSKETNASSTLDDEASKSPGFSPTAATMLVRRQPSLNLLGNSTTREGLTSVDKDRRQSMIIGTQSRSSSISTGQLNSSGKSIRSKMPKDQLARPYWMMRLLLGTFATSRTTGSGIFITDSLFFPRDLWSTKNVKIKGEEEKIQAYSLVVQELQQLGRVDKDDIPSLFRSLDAFEKVIGQAQTLLAKKLGGDVISSPTLPVRETPQTPGKKSSSLSFSKFLKNGASEKGDGSPASLMRDFEGEHVLLQRTTSQLFGLAQLLEQINLNLNTESLTVKDQLRLEQAYSRAADFFSRVVVKLYLADASHLLHSRLANKLHIA